MNVYTCTLNLAIDLFIETDELIPFKVNRTVDDDIQANGKGINVSLVLKMLGIDSVALGFKAGFTGQYIEDYVNLRGIQSDFIEVPGKTRINVFTKVNNENVEYKLVNQGPVVSQEAIEQLKSQISKIPSGAYLCISGSFPKGVKPNLLVEMSKICFEKGIHLIIDNSSPEVLQCLPYKPFLVKPNEEEIHSWLGVLIENQAVAIAQAKKLIELGAENVLLSLGDQGCLFINEKEVLYGNSPMGKVVNTACSGDTLLGTFIAYYLKNKSSQDALKAAIAAGSSTAFRQGLTDFSDTKELEEQIKLIEGVE